MTEYISEHKLRLYCRNQGKGKGTQYMMDSHHAKDRTFPEVFTGENLAYCVSAAIKKGWRIDKTSKTALCPACKKDH